MAYEVSGYRLKLSSDYGVTHAYGLLSQTVSGTIAGFTLTASATLATASIGVGSKIHIGAGLDEYTVFSVVTTVITVVEALTQTYNAGTGLRIDVVSAWTGTDGFGSLATQTDGTKQPGFIPNIVNGLNAIEFPGGTKSLPLANVPASDNIFATGGTLMMVFAADTAGSSTFGRVIDKGNNAGNSAWNIITSIFSGGFYRVTFNQTTTEILGTFTTNSIFSISETQILTLTYDASHPEIPPVMRVIGVAVPVNTDSAPTGTAISDAGGIYTIGNRPAGDRGLDGRIPACYAWPYVLSDYDTSNMEMFLATKWGITLYDNPSKYYGGREYLTSSPSVPATVPMLLCLHGGGGDALTFVEQLQLRDLFSEEAVLVFPTATRNNTLTQTNTWNSGGLQTFNTAPDSTYLPDLCDFVTQQVETQGFTISEIYIVGHSNGGMMGYRLVIDHPTKFAGVFAMSADVQIPNPDVYTGRIQHWHGQDDMNVPLAGGIGIGGVYYTPVVPTVQEFTHVNNGTGVILGTSDPLVIADFNIVPSPAGHNLNTIKPVLALPPYNTTIAQLIYNFVFPS